jgi:hypothetical protein
MSLESHEYLGSGTHKLDGIEVKENSIRINKFDTQIELYTMDHSRMGREARQLFVGQFRNIALFNNCVFEINAKLVNVNDISTTIKLYVGSSTKYNGNTTIHDHIEGKFDIIHFDDDFISIIHNKDLESDHKIAILKSLTS